MALRAHREVERLVGKPLAAVPAPKRLRRTPLPLRPHVLRKCAGHPRLASVERLEDPLKVGELAVEAEQVAGVREERLRGVVTLVDGPPARAEVFEARP